MDSTATVSPRSRLTAALALATALATLMIIAIGGATDDARAQGVVAKVKALDNRFLPAKITISKGQVVRWKNAGNAAHNVKGPGFASKTLVTGAIYKKRFATRGTFAYVCTFHPGMKGKVVVTK